MEYDDDSEISKRYQPVRRQGRKSTKPEPEPDPKRSSKIYITYPKFKELIMEHDPFRKVIYEVLKEISCCHKALGLVLKRFITKYGSLDSKFLSDNQVSVTLSEKKTDLLSTLTRRPFNADYEMFEYLKTQNPEDREGVLEKLADSLPPKEKRKFDLIIKKLTHELKAIDIENIIQVTPRILNVLRDFGYAMPKSDCPDLQNEYVDPYSSESILEKLELIELITAQNDISPEELDNLYKVLFPTNRRLMNPRSINARTYAGQSSGNFE